MKKITTLFMLTYYLTTFSQTELYPTEMGSLVNITSNVQQEWGVQSLELQTTNLNAPCVEEVPSNALEVFFNTYSTTPQIMANDITVAED